MDRIGSLFSSVKNRIWTSEPPPDINKGIERPKVWIRAEPKSERGFMGAQLQKEVRQNFEVALLQLLARRSQLSLEHRSQLINEGEAYTHLRIQHLDAGREASWNKSKGSTLLQMVSAAAQFGMMGSNQYPKMLGDLLKKVPQIKSIPKVGELIWSATKPATQKMLRKQLGKYGPGVARLPSEFGENNKIMYDADIGAHTMQERLYQDLKQTNATQKQDDQASQTGAEDATKEIIASGARVRAQIATAA